MTVPDTRQNGLQKKINLQVRNEIRKGIYLPGARLPSRSVFRQLNCTTPVTVHKAFAKLIQDGFVRSEAQRGTFVTDYPPCLSNYAIVYPGHFNSDYPEVSFWKIMANIAQSRKYSPQRHFTIYTDINGHIDEPNYCQLQSDVHSEKLAGIIFLSNPYLFAKTPLFAEIMSRSELPKVAFMGGDAFALPFVTYNRRSLLQKCFIRLKKKGCRRLAVLSAMAQAGGSTGLQVEAEIQKSAGKYGLVILPHHLQLIHPSLALRARQLTQLLLRCRKEEQPDALLILDDSIAEAATRGIADVGIDCSEKLTVMVFCNFPEPPITAVPVTFFGVDVECVLERCLELLDCQHAGKPVPAKTLVSIAFKDGHNNLTSTKVVCPSKVPG